MFFGPTESFWFYFFGQKLFLKWVHCLLPLSRRRLRTALELICRPAWVKSWLVHHLFFSDFFLLSLKINASSPGEVILFSSAFFFPSGGYWFCRIKLLINPANSCPTHSKRFCNIFLVKFRVFVQTKDTSTLSSGIRNDKLLLPYFFFQL